MRFWLAPSYFFISRNTVRKSRVAHAARKSSRASSLGDTR
jgi:hypothetical protein